MRCATTNVTESNRKSQEAETMPAPTRAGMEAIYIGCLEYRYKPLVTGLSTGASAIFTLTMMYIAIPNKLMGRPM
jgi:hypothetical protein